MAAKRKAGNALLNEITKYETALDKDPDNFEHYGQLIELLLRDGNTARAKILMEQGRIVNKKNSVSVDSRYGFACACVSVWKGDRYAQIVLMFVFVTVNSYDQVVLSYVC